jgi:C-5 cytosine-specific DNA methylase
MKQVAALYVEPEEQRADERPLAIDLFCGLGGWTEGLLAEGYRVVGYDIKAHQYDGERYPAKLVVQDVLAIHGSAFKAAALIVASPPCQEYSYMAMPWSLAKAKAAAIRADTTGAEVERLNRMFNACFRIQREASEAAGHHIPMVVENVRGAIPWVGRSRWNYGSFHLWGDVPALMPSAKAFKGGYTGHGWKHPSDSRHTPGLDFTRFAGKHALEGMKNGSGGSWFGVNPNGTRGALNNARDGLKQPGLSGICNNGKGDAWFQDGAAKHGSKSSARKAASARIAKIPLPLSRWIAATYKPSIASTAIKEGRN